MEDAWKNVKVMLGDKEITGIVPLNYAAPKPRRYITVRFLDGPVHGRTINTIPQECVETMRIMYYNERPYIKCLYDLKYENMEYTATFYNLI